VTILCIVYELHLAANKIKPLSIAMKTQERAPIAPLSTNKIFRSGVKSLNILISSYHLSDIFVQF